MRKLKIIFVILILLIAIFAVSLYYLNTYYLPQVIKAKIIQEASNKFKVNIELEHIKLDIFKGIVLYDVTITQEKDNKPLLEIKTISANFLILPFFKERKIIFPVINIDTPKLDIIRYEDNRFNFQDLIPKQTGKIESSPPVLIYKINIHNAQINLLDKTTQPNIQQTLKVDNLKAQASLSGINFEAKGAIINKKQTSDLELTGKYQFKTNELIISSHIKRIDMLAYLAYVKNLPITIESLILDNFNAECNLVDNILSIEANTYITDTYLIKDKNLLTDIDTRLKASFTIDLRNKSSFDYLININDLKAKLTGPQIPEKTKIEYAKLEIAPNVLDIKNARVRILEASTEIIGKIENFSNPIFYLSLKSKDVGLSKAKNLLRDYFDFLDPIILDGTTDIDLSVSKLKDKEELELSGSLGLKNATIKIKDTPYAINAIKGLINFSKDNIGWSNLSFSLFEEIFNSQAAISDFKSPLITLKLTSDKINVSTKINTTQKNKFDIEYLEGSYYDSKVKISGDLNIEENNKYLVDLDIKSQVELDNLKEIKDFSSEIISKIKPKGICEISGRIKGNIKDPKTLNALVDLISDELKLYDLKFKNLKMQLAQENQQIKIPQSSCSFYNGSIAMNGLVDLEKKYFPYAFKIIVEESDLSKLKLDTPIKDKTFKGILNATLVLSGQTDSLEKLKGQAEFLIKDGYLWEFDPLKKLGDFLFIPQYDALIFKEAKGAFNIYDKKAFTENLVFSSDVILLFCSGNLDFAGNLDFEVTPKPPLVETMEETEEETIEDLGDYEKFFAGIFSEAGGIFTVNLTGTIKEPKFKKKIIVMDVIDKVTDGVVDRFKKIADLFFGDTSK